ncbi:MAG: hypothetical protein ACFFFK_09740 [Candidatus Thorarchaeota archaeon]
MAQKKKKTESTPTLRDEMLKELSIDDTESKRDVPVMTRLDTRVIGLLDMLIKLNIFKSRSEAVAAIVEKTLLPQQEKFDLLQEQLSKLEEIEDTAKGIALDVMKG